MTAVLQPPRSARAADTAPSPHVPAKTCVPLKRSAGYKTTSAIRAKDTTSFSWVPGAVESYRPGAIVRKKSRILLRKLPLRRESLSRGLRRRRQWLNREDKDTDKRYRDPQNSVQISGLVLSSSAPTAVITRRSP